MNRRRRRGTWPPSGEAGSALTPGVRLVQRALAAGAELAAGLRMLPGPGLREDHRSTTGAPWRTRSESQTQPSSASWGHFLGFVFNALPLSRPLPAQSARFNLNVVLDVSCPSPPFSRPSSWYPLTEDYGLYPLRNTPIHPLLEIRTPWPPLACKQQAPKTFPAWDLLSPGKSHFQLTKFIPQLTFDMLEGLLLIDSIK